MDISWPDDSIFDPFTVSEHTYKTVSSHDIKCAILIPKTLKPGLHPVIFNFHGGFFVTGHSLFAPFFPPSASPLALENSGIIVSADYRLLPSPNGVADILEDLEDFWQWSKTELPRVLEQVAPGHLIDFSKVLVVGGSAGGYCAAQVALSHPDEISALALIYPCLDPKDKLYLKGPAEGEPTVLRYPLDEMPSVPDTVAWIEKEKNSVASKGGFEATLFATSACQNGFFASQIFDSKNMDLDAFLPLERIKTCAKLPLRVWLMHGDDDSTVPIRGSHEFVRILQEKLPETTLRFDICPGQDHAFDYDEKKWEPLAPAALSFVRDGWLGQE
ncbi:hypothetical protein AK830_g7210 [Neonectria ditissima]|uniref:Alpha/beta hydrolase fold-3 domain-containing protein n=1 Tax=Neonectria ditissima TaxID=78410 RepID=A0A0P7BGE8_9HYPO|nr:hypothetical protein AK830_g7210 [Neonectria ditissima]